MVKGLLNAENVAVFTLIFILGSSVLFCPATAAPTISTIQLGNTVFIGEQGLDISPAMGTDTILGWWASGASTTSSPDYTISVSNPESFSVNPSDFASRTGVWYHLSSDYKVNGPAFTVNDPTLNLRVEDATVGVDVTDKWVPTDDDLRFRIETNLVQMVQRGVSSVPVTIKVRSPDGGIYSSLLNKDGASTSIDPYQISSTPQYTGSIWSTKNRAVYPTGTYSIWVECNVNSMNDNYGQSGKTISSTVSLLNQDQNPLIGNKAYVTNPTPVVTTTTTRIPAIVTTTVTTALPTTIPATTSRSMEMVTSETIPTTPSIVESTAVPTTHTPGFEAGLVIAAVLFGVVLCMKKK